MAVTDGIWNAQDLLASWWYVPSVMLEEIDARSARIVSDRNHPGPALSQPASAQQRGLALWVYGTILAQSACQSAVITALLFLGAWDTIRQRLRDWLYDGQDKAAPCQTHVEVSACFAPLLRWLLSWWQAHDLALAIDATLHGDQVTALVLSVLYRGSAIPVAWCILPANQPGAWMGPILRLLRLLRPAIPSSMTVLILADRGLWSPRLWERIRDLGWHPLLRIQGTTTFTPAGRDRVRSRDLVQIGQGWVGRGRLGTPKKRQLSVTLIAIWTADQKEPWVVVSDLPPGRVGVSWYALRMWVELGFRALKAVGWKWEHTRRRNPPRIERYWLILAVATLWTLATGTRVEEATELRVAPARLQTPPARLRGAGRVSRACLLWGCGACTINWGVAGCGHACGCAPSPGPSRLRTSIFLSQPNPNILSTLVSQSPPELTSHQP